MLSNFNTISKIFLMRLCLVGVSTCLFACSNNSPAPVYDLANTSNLKSKHNHSANKLSSANRLNSTSRLNSTRTPGSLPKIHIVKPGDTVYSIAWDYSLDHHHLARINLLNNNIIYPGQKLHLVSKQNRPYFEAGSLLAAIEDEVLERPIIKNASQMATTRSKKPRTKTKSSRQASTQNVNRSKKIVARKSQQNTKTVSRQVKPFKRAVTTERSLKWIWPADGKIIARFSAKTNANKGLDIDAKRGQPVRATARGRVVYKGSGLRGYGNLVIIKHSTNYLSAYAHNDKIHVNENEVVKSGQRIADVGSSGSQRDKLHFEIRYKGKPVDPLNYLPQRKF